MKARFIGGSMDGQTDERPMFGKTHIVVDIAASTAEYYVRSRPDYERNEDGTIIAIAFRIEKTEAVDITSREIPPGFEGGRR